jgi:hypothetical protein
MSQDITLRLFKYFAQFVPKAVLTDLLVQPEHSSEAGYAEVKAELMLPSERIINEITTYICSSNPDFVADKVRNAPGIILFVEYGNINTNPASEYGVQKSVAITIAHEFNRSNNDNLNEALLMNNCNNLLNHLLITLEYDQNYNNGCGVIGQMEFPAQVAPIDPESFYGRVGWTAFLTVKENMVYDPLDTPWPDPGGQSPRSVIEQRLKTLEDNQITLDNEVTEQSQNAVKSSGIWAALQALWESVAQAFATLKTSQIENDSEFITADDIPAIPSVASDLGNDSEVDGVNVKDALNWLKGNSLNTWELVANINVVDVNDGSYVDIIQLDISTGNELMILQYKDSGDNGAAMTNMITFNMNTNDNIIIYTGTQPLQHFYGVPLGVRYRGLSVYTFIDSDIVQNSTHWVRSANESWSSLSRGTNYGYSFGKSYPSIESIRIRVANNSKILLWKRKLV